MTTESRKVAGAVALAAASGAVEAANNAGVAELVAKIRSSDDKVRGPAWQGAGPCGAPAVKPLAAVLSDPDFEVARSAKRAIWQIVRYAGRPGAAKEAKSVTVELVSLLSGSAPAVKREVLWMLSEIGGDDVVAPMASCLSDPELQEDARCALQRLPGRQAVAALRKAMASAREEFKFALAESLRARGEKVTGYPSKKLVPTKATQVKAG